VPYIRQTRDKRGFEQTYVMHAYHQGQGGPGRARVLYLFRSPANLRIGRTALDAEVMEALEHTHPDLSFDWGSISREVAPPPRPEPSNDRYARRPGQRGSDRPPSRPASGPPARPVATTPALPNGAAPPPVPADDSLLGRTLGAAVSARLRQRYRELTDRVNRRARTPEERDRLMERLGRLNPEDWQDEATIRAQSASVDGAWNAIAAELPSRRRGRRGGRRRMEGDRQASGIMAGETETDPVGEDGHATDQNATLGASAGSGGSGHDGDALGPAAAAGDDAEAPDAADPEVPVGD
jgi:hypothetical protein